MRRSGPWLAVGIAALVGAAFLVAIAMRSRVGGPVAWAHLGTADVHSLAFVPGTTDRLLFGHHGGILESADGGRTWSSLDVRTDAMAMVPAADGSVVVAGHDVFVASEDEGATWRPIPADLPNLDIHGFARDPSAPQHMWAYLAQGGVYESLDNGLHWTLVIDGHRPFLTAISAGATVALLGIDPFSGLVTSRDDGRGWELLSQPPSFPVLSLVATLAGRCVMIGTSDGLLRSEDAGRTWISLPLPAPVLAIAVSPDAGTIAVVTKSTDFYRSGDGGGSWPGP